MPGKIVFVGVLFLTGCATIMHGSRQEIGLSSNPSGAVVRTGRKRCTTPCVLNLSRRRSHAFTFQKEGYEEAGDSVSSDTSGWVFGNLIFGMFPGLIVDFISGGAYKLEPDSVRVRLVKEGEGRERY